MAGLGITFKPTDQSAQMGPGQASKEGGLQQAIQLLSLRYPKVSGAASPVGSPSMLAGNTPRLSGFNPNAAIFQALIKAFSQGGSTQPAGMPQTSLGSPLVGAARAFAQSPAPAPNFQYEQPGGAGSAPSKAWGPDVPSPAGPDVFQQVNTGGMAPRTSYGDQILRKAGQQFL